MIYYSSIENLTKIKQKAFVNGFSAIPSEEQRQALQLTA
jgi:hypothetical protein